MRDNITNKIATLVLEYYSGYPSIMRSDILHTQEVVSYTRMIALSEKLDPNEVMMLEIAAWLHDIGCPRSNEIYGNSLPVNQQSVGREVTRELLSNIDELTSDQKQWLIDVVGTHHQFADSVRLRFTALFEADLIVNILSGYYAKDQAANLYHKLVTSDSGKQIFKTVICNSLNVVV